MIRITADELAYRVLPQVRPGRALADSEWRTLVHAADALLINLPFTIDAETVADNVERFLCEGRSRRAWRCRVLLTLVEHSTWPYYGRSFSALDRASRREMIQARYVAGSALFRICAKVRYLVVMGAYGDQRALRALKVRTRRSTQPATARVATDSSRSLPLLG